MRRGWEKNRGSRIEPLEDRVCLTVSVELVHTDLFVRGDSDGSVEITATADGMFEVTDNGAWVASAEGVENIHIRLGNRQPDTSGSNAPSGEDVTLNLNQQTVRSVMARLGSGDDSFALLGGTAGRVRVLTGNGSDSVTIDSEIKGLSILAGKGDDSIQILASSHVEHRFFASLGSGDNQLMVEGLIPGKTAVRAGQGADRITLDESAELGRSSLRLGGGENTVEIHGSSQSMKVLSGSPRGISGSATDADSLQFLLADSGQVNGNLMVATGSTDSDTVIMEGSVDGNLVVIDRPTGKQGTRDGSFEPRTGTNQVTIAKSAQIKGTLLGKFRHSLTTIDHLGTLEKDIRVFTDVADQLTVNLDEHATLGGELVIRARDQHLDDDQLDGEPQPDRDLPTGNMQQNLAGQTDAANRGDLRAGRQTERKEESRDGERETQGRTSSRNSSGAGSRNSASGR